ncbi:MAG: hypothetical protein JNK05_18820 [Myxococcales bacterium]|nr:hypothetical protein [Myxococcales bacterium]
MVLGKPLHLAVVHSIDVESVAEGILRERAVLRRTFARLMGLDEGHVVATVAALCALHDLGKFDARFQAKAPDAVSALGRSDEWAGIVGAGHDHGSGGNFAFESWRTEQRDEFDAPAQPRSTQAPSRSTRLSGPRTLQRCSPFVLRTRRDRLVVVAVAPVRHSARCRQFGATAPSSIFP